jgi:hypothetical protein
MAEDPDDAFDSPFAHVPAAGAGPSPMQDGPTTFSQLEAGAGRVNLRDVSSRRRIVAKVIVAVVLGAFVVALLAVLLTR